MEPTLYTIHRKGERGLRIVGDRFHLMALLFVPLWLVWHGLWLTTAAVVVLLVAVGVLAPDGLLPAIYGLGLILALEGSSFIRAELRLRGWREAGVVEARSEAGAEELYLTGQGA